MQAVLQVTVEASFPVTEWRTRILVQAIQCPLNIRSPCQLSVADVLSNSTMLEQGIGYAKRKVDGKELTKDTT